MSRLSPFLSVFLALAPLPALATTPVAERGETEKIERLIEIGRHDQALARLEVFLGEHPGEPQARFMKSIALAETGRVEEAIEVLSRLTAEHPELPQPFNNLAVLHAMRGDLEQAREALLGAIEAQPENGRYHENLADVYVELADRSYRKSVELAPQGGRAETKLGLLEAVLETSSEGPAMPPRTPDGATPGGADEPASEPPAPGEAVAETPEAAECAGAVAAVRAWAWAWSSQNADGYLSSYAADYEPSGGLSRKQWAAARRERLERPRFIEVTLDDLEVELCAERRARVSFTQRYRSNTYQDRVRKELWLSRPEEKWVISGERTLD